MAARTGQNDDWRTKALAQLAVAYATIVDLVQKGKRGPQIIEILLRALQAAREGTLAGIVLRATSTDNLQAVLSLLVSETGMPDHLKKYLSERGVRYIGEIYKLIWDRRGANVKEVHTELFSFLKVSLGLPEFVDIETAWRPPYWNDPNFFAALAQPLGQAVKVRPRMVRSYSKQSVDDLSRYLTNNLRWYHSEGMHYAGLWLIHRNFNVGMIKDKQSTLFPHSGLWAAALLPARWTTPAEVPAEWTRELEVIEQEKAAACERVQLRAAERRDRVVQRFQPPVEVLLPAPPQQGDFLHRMLNDQEYLGVLFRSVDELPISVRLANCLQNRDIRLVGEILLSSDAEKLKWKNFGRKTAKELKEIVQPLLGVSHDSIPASQLEVLRRALQLRRDSNDIDEILSTVREQFKL